MGLVLPPWEARFGYLVMPVSYLNTISSKEYRRKVEAQRLNVQIDLIYPLKYTIL